MQRLRKKPIPLPPITIEAKPVWTSEDGEYAVIEGPFPPGLPRSLDSKDIGTAMRRDPETIQVRGGTTQPRRYAKVASYSVTPNENEYGEICP